MGLTILDHLIVAILFVAMPILSVADYRKLHARLEAGTTTARLLFYRSIIIWNWGLTIAVVALWIVRSRSFPLGARSRRKGSPAWRSSSREILHEGAQIPGCLPAKKIDGDSAVDGITEFCGLSMSVCTGRHHDVGLLARPGYAGRCAGGAYRACETFFSDGVGMDTKGAGPSSRCLGCYGSALLHDDGTLAGAGSDFRRRRPAGEFFVHDPCDVRVYRDRVALLDLYEDVESWSLSSLEDGFPTASPTGFVVAECYGFDSPDEVGQCRIAHQVFETVSVGGCHELHTTLGDRARGGRFRLGADLVDDDDFGHVILDGLDHHGMLLAGMRHLHAPGPADGRVGDVAISGDLVRCIDDDDPPTSLIREQASGLPQERRLSYSGPAYQKCTAPGLDDITKNLHRPVHRSADATGEADDVGVPISDRRDAVQGPFDPRAVVGREITHPSEDAGEVFPFDCSRPQRHRGPIESCLGQPSEIEDDFEKVVQVGPSAQFGFDSRW